MKEPGKKDQPPTDSPLHTGGENLSDHHDSIRRTLLEKIGSSDPATRIAAVEALSELPAKEAVPFALQALYDQDNAGKRNAAFEVLKKFGNRAVPFLHEHLSTDDADVRMFLITLIGDLRDHSHLAFVISSLEDREENIVSAAITAVGRIGDFSAASRLIPYLEGNNLWLQFQAVEAAGQMHAPSLLPYLIHLLDSNFCRKAAIKALGKYQHRDTYGALSSILVRDNVCDFDVLDSLIRLYNTSKQHQTIIRNVCRVALNDQQIQTLLQHLKDGSRSEQFKLSQLLAWCGTPEGLQRLHDFETDPQFGEQALRTLQSVHALRSFVEPFPMTNSTFASLTDLVYASSGVRFDESSRYMISRRLSARLEKLKLSSFQDYLSYLREDPEREAEMDHVIDLITTHETYFFREERQLHAFSDELLPELKEIKKDFRSLRIWSAGCSSGEEPYTIAMLCLENHNLRDWNVNIIATDISQHMVERARNATYGESSFRSTAEAFKAKYFENAGNETYKVKDEVKKLVSFLKLNLMDEANSGILAEVDVVFCRNVLIYFDGESKKKAIHTFFHKLRKGGYLLLGHSESLINLSTHFQLRHLKNDLVYQK